MGDRWLGIKLAVVLSTLYYANSSDQQAIMILYIVVLLLVAITKADDVTVGTRTNPGASCHDIYQRNPTTQGDLLGNSV